LLLGEVPEERLSVAALLEDMRSRHHGGNAARRTSVGLSTFSDALVSAASTARGT
jgi:hypothetical protein